MNGEITAVDLEAHCYLKLAKKNRILRRQSNRTRPTNSFRLVASLALAISFGSSGKWKLLPGGVVYVLNRVMNRPKFVHLTSRPTTRA